MNSYISWVDFDPEARQYARELLKLAKFPDARDELGLATLRDGISDVLFPATSTIHTRLRYMFFIPWLVQIADQETKGVRDHFTILEYNLIRALNKGHTGDGIIGGTTGDSLKRLPSSVYWAALGNLGIRTLSGTLKALLSDNAGELRKNLWYGKFPERPKGLLKKANFKLEQPEKDYFLGRLETCAKDSLFHEILSTPDLVAQLQTDVDIAPWDLVGVSPQNADLLEQARIFSDLMYGAAVLYNLLLMRKAAQDENSYMVKNGKTDLKELEQQLADWQSLERPDLKDWDVYALARLQNRNVKSATLTFISDWQKCVLTTGDLANSADAQEFITKREFALKGHQKKARLSHQDALRRWSGLAGMNRMTFRWPIAKGYIIELTQ
ncbi:MAG: DUF6361 family protein [Paracoccaceae bacterium]|uniref:DUF6361 family protein n=1 Tax=Paracoccaceae TaxID=31989 RepID=UPI00329A1DB1